MPEIDLDRLEKAAELLRFAFYGLMLVAAAAALSGAPGWGFLTLVLGGAAQVGRASFEEFAASGRGSRAHQSAKSAIASRAPAQWRHTEARRAQGAGRLRVSHGRR